MLGKLCAACYLNCLFAQNEKIFRGQNQCFGLKSLFSGTLTRMGFFENCKFISHKKLSLGKRLALGGLKNGRFNTELKGHIKENVFLGFKQYPEYANMTVSLSETLRFLM